MSRYAILHEIEKIDPVKDHQRIVFLSCCYEFPFDTTRAVEFALFRAFCVQSISALLDRTAEFQERAQKRYAPGSATAAAAHQNTPSELSERICDRGARTGIYKFMSSTFCRSGFADCSRAQSCAS